MKLNKEIWKPIAGFKEHYVVSNYGRVKRLAHTYVDKLGRIESLKERVFKKHFYPNGYEYVCLRKGDKITTFCVHRLVALAFIPNPDNYQIVDHINTDIHDNRVENLRWVTPKMNSRNPLTYARNFTSHGKSVEKLDKDGNVLGSYVSISEAARRNGVSFSAVSKCINGYDKTSAGFYWRVKKEL